MQAVHALMSARLCASVQARERASIASVRVCVCVCEHVRVCMAFATHVNVSCAWYVSLAMHSHAVRKLRVSGGWQGHRHEGLRLHAPVPAAPVANAALRLWRAEL